MQIQSTQPNGEVINLYYDFWEQFYLQITFKQIQEFHKNDCARLKCCSATASKKMLHDAYETLQDETFNGLLLHIDVSDILKSKSFSIEQTKVVAVAKFENNWSKIHVTWCYKSAFIWHCFIQEDYRIWRKLFY